MSVILGIDPAKSTGWAFHGDKGILACGVFDFTPYSMAVFDHPSFQPDVVCFEHPQIYQPTKSKGDPNNLAGILVQIGSWSRYYNSTYGAKIRTVEPAGWKGQLDKDVCAGRVYDMLSSEEQQIVSRCGTGLKRNPMLDMMDAVGIALFAAGRKLRFA